MIVSYGFLGIYGTAQILQVYFQENFANLKRKFILWAIKFFSLWASNLHHNVFFNFQSDIATFIFIL